MLRALSAIEKTCTILTQPSDSNGLLIVKLKRKLQYRVHVLSEAVKPQAILRFL